MKRITWWPQAWLGLTFNWGIAGRLMSRRFPAEIGAASDRALYLAAVFWTLGYDTIYAHQDSEDDALVGVKSTARLFGEHSRTWIAGFYLLHAILVGAALVLVEATPWVTAPYALYTAHLFNQIRDMDPNNGATCLGVFKSNRIAGLLLAAGLVLTALL